MTLQQPRGNITHSQTEAICDHRQCPDSAELHDYSSLSILSRCGINKRIRPAITATATTSTPSRRQRRQRETKQLLTFAIAALFLCTGTVGFNYANDGASDTCLDGTYAWIDRIRSTCSVTIQKHRVHIGDRVRDETSSSSFFSSVDQDGDGELEPPEIAKFLRESIGGTAFDTQKEVDTGVNRVMEKLDLNNDYGIDKSDVFSYWMKLESLLNADEVADWVVHAVQLPEYLGNIFRKNVVTGYDFPELVENEGEAIFTELGIERTAFRKKLVRHIHAAMLGIGSVPSNPSEIKYELETCYTVSFSWEKSTAEGFPVHSYRIQRRAVGLHDAGDSTRKLNVSTNPPPAAVPATNNLVTSGSGIQTANGKDSLRVTEQSYPPPLTSDWATVYCGGENEFVDSTLENGHNYVYRFQAWNSVGRSEWVTVDISRALKKKGCSLKRSNPNSASRSVNMGSDDWSGSTLDPSSVFGGLYFFMTFIMTAIRGLIALFGVAAAIMKFQRGNATSTTLAKAKPIFPWFFKGINLFSKRVMGVDVVPASLLGDKQSIRDEATIHDMTVKAVGLNGYSGNISDDENYTKSTERRITFKKKKVTSFDDSHIGDRRAMLTRAKSASTGDLGRFEEVTEKNDAPSMKKPLSIMKRLRQLSSESSKTDSSIPRSVDVSCCDIPLCSVAESAGHSTREGSTASDESDSIKAQDSEDFDDYNACISCRKRYKFGKRWRHHCARCTATFCHKHGRTTHSNLTSCKVPGTCVCNVCLESDQYNSRRKTDQRSTGKLKSFR